MLQLVMLIYCVTNNLNGKRYIGQTTKPLKERWYGHVAFSRNPRGYISYFHKAMAKHGVENFAITEVYRCSSQQELNRREAEAIQEYGTMAPNGYNLHPGGAPDSGYQPTVDQRKRMGSTMRAKWQDPEYRRFMRSVNHARARKHAECHSDRPHYAKKMCKECYLDCRRSLVIISICHAGVPRARSRMGKQLNLCPKCCQTVRNRVRKGCSLEGWSPVPLPESFRLSPKLSSQMDK